MRKCDYCKHNETCTFSDISNCAVRYYIHFEMEEPIGQTERQKLIRLLQGKSLDTKDDVEYVADFMLENGVQIK